MFDLDRRSLMKSVTAATALAGQSLKASAAAAQEAAPYVAPRGQNGRFVRFPDLNLESYHEFLGGYIKWKDKTFIPLYEARMVEVFKANGVADPHHPTDLPMTKILPIVEKDPILSVFGRMVFDGQFYSHMALRDAFHAKEDLYLTELEKADNASGPGTIELDKSLVIPDYCKHEIHNQIGGYIGDPFAGYIYHYAFQKLFDGAVQQDQMFDALAAACPVPEDGKVLRILDNATGYGGLATAMKRRFPDAEVWALDMAAPMIRYGHMRSNRLGVPVRYVNRLAEDNKFPDNYFDIVISTSFHHEVTAEKSKKIFSEIQRTLRPGGVFRPAESGINGYPPDPVSQMWHYLNYRWNHEVWTIEWGDMDRFGSMREAGLKVSEKGAQAGTGYTWIPGATAWKI